MLHVVLGTIERESHHRCQQQRSLSADPTTPRLLLLPDPPTLPRALRLADAARRC